MEKILYLYNEVDGVKEPFKVDGEAITIYKFEYGAERMGSTPSISAEVNSFQCLDDLWDGVFTEFKGERFYVRDTPTSEKNNQSQMYRHEVKFLSERDKLNSVFFIDAVQTNPDLDKYKSNTVVVQFMGDINEFVGRLNAALAYSGVGYTAVVDDGISTEPKEVSFEKKYISEALQTAFETYNIPYYFKDKVIHFGYTDNAIPNVLRYGSEDALISVTKENANAKIVRRITGVGSTDNLPYYYPNTSPKGYIRASAGLGNKGIKDKDIILFDTYVFSNKVDMTKPIVRNVSSASIFSYKYAESPSTQYTEYNAGTYNFQINLTNTTNVFIKFKFGIRVTQTGVVKIAPYTVYRGMQQYARWKINGTPTITSPNGVLVYSKWDGDFLVFTATTKGDYTLDMELRFTYNGYTEYEIKVGGEIRPVEDWSYDGDIVSLESLGLRLAEGASPVNGDEIRQVVDKRIPVEKNLMPPIYRETLGAERFYNAVNNKYPIPDGEGFYEFENEYLSNDPQEEFAEFPDIKPTIKGMTNSLGQRIDMFSEFAYDLNDNDNKDEEGNYEHPYFFAKLRKLDFNLFDHAIESQAMNVAMTSGTVGACQFEISVGENTQKNIVQVDDAGRLKRDDKGNVLWQNQNSQDRQNDTINYEVWIALKKDINTYPQIMPNASMNFKPSVNDTFVLLGIDLPMAYVTAAEKKLEQSLIKEMYLNNTEKFKFSIDFSRIYLEENPNVLELLDENSRVIVEYNGKQYTLYVSSYKYTVDDKPLPNISIELTETLEAGQNSLKKALGTIEQDILNSVGNMDILTKGLRYFVRKDIDDFVRGLLTFSKGIQSDDYDSGTLGAGFSLRKDESGKSLLEVDELYVRLRAVFTALEIKHAYHVGGEIILSPAGMQCKRVESVTDTRPFLTSDGETIKTSDGMQYAVQGDTLTAYRCYFENTDGEKSIVSQFKVGDQAMCREFNTAELDGQTVINRYYWRKVIGVGSDYIDLSMTDCMSGSDAPMAGDSIVALGNESDEARQNAIVITAYGVGSPSIKMYRKINDYTLSDGKAEIIISPQGNKFTGDLYLTTGESITESVDYAISAADRAEQAAQDAANAAANAESEANKANDRLNEWAADGVISPSEKQGLNDEKVRIEADRNDIDNSYLKYDISYDRTQYYAYQEKYKADLGELTASYPEVIPIPDYFANDQHNYYSERTAVLNAIASAAKDFAEQARLTSKQAIADAEAAKQVAEEARQEAMDAAERLDKWAEDGVISPTEKPSLLDEIARIDSDKQEIEYGYNKYDIAEPTAYNTAYTAYRAYLVTLTQPTPENIPIPSDFRSKQEEYYTQRSAAFDAIATAAKNYAEKIVSSSEEGLRSEFQSKFTFLADQINLKVSQTDYDANNQEIQQQISEINQTASNIRLTVTKSTASVNYMLNSGNFFDSTHWSYIGMKGVYKIIQKTLNGISTNVLQFNITEHTNTWAHLSADFLPNTFIEDGTYTLSIKAATKVFKGFKVGFRDSKGNVYYDKTFPYSGSGVYTYTFDYKSARHSTEDTKLTRFCIFPYPDAITTLPATVGVYWVMLQKGNVATSWQPSSVDLEDALVTTGIDIKNREINLQADRVFFKSNDGETTVRIFTEDGKIEAERIDTDTLAAKRVIATSAIGAVLIENGKMQMSDRNGKLKLIVSGNNLSTSSSDRNVTLQSKTVTLPETNDSIITVGKTVLCSFSTNNGAYVKIPPMRVTMNMTSINDYVTNGRLLCHYRLYLDGTELKSEQRVATGTAQNLSFTSDEIKVDPRSLNAGTHEIYITLQFKAESGDLSNPRKIDTAGWTFKPSVSTSNLIAISYPTDYTEIAANGFRASAGLNKYIMQTADKAELRFGNYILRLDANGIRASNNGGTGAWVDVVPPTTFSEL